MWDDGSPNPSYHYNVADDGIRPYDPLMPHDDGSMAAIIGTSAPLQENDYYFESAEDTELTAGFWFPEMQWTNRQPLLTGNAHFQDCYVHYRIVKAGSCDITYPPY